MKLILSNIFEIRFNIVLSTTILLVSFQTKNLVFISRLSYGYYILRPSPLT